MKTKQIKKYARWLIWRDQTKFNKTIPYRSIYYARRISAVGDNWKRMEKLEVMKEIAEKLNILIKPRKEVTQYQYKTNPKIKINGKSYTMLISKPLAKCHTDKFIYRFDTKKLDQKQ